MTEHASAFNAKTDDERTRLQEEAAAATRFVDEGEKAQPCPACGSSGLLSGDLSAESEPMYDSGTLFVEFHCAACGLTLGTIEEQALADIPLRFKDTRTTELHESFQADYMDDDENM